MTQEQKDKKAAINRINDRYRQIVIQFGEDSAPARDYRAKMEKLGGDHMTESGYISKGKASLDSMSMKDINAMERQPTAGEIMDRGREYISTTEEVSPEEVTKEDITEYYEIKAEVMDMLADLGDYDSDAIAKYRKKHNKPKGKLTYEELHQAVREWRKQSYEARKRFHARRNPERKEAKEKYFSGEPQSAEQTDKTKPSGKIAPPRSENMRTQGVTNKV